MKYLVGGCMYAPDLGQYYVRRGHGSVGQVCQDANFQQVRRPIRSLKCGWS